MIEETFEQGDLFSLRACLRDMLARYRSENSDKALRYAVIKTFELTYEMVDKTMHKFVAAKTPAGEAASKMPMQDLIRAADQAELLRSGWPVWRQYLENHSKTVHAYGEAVASSGAEGLDEFSIKVHALLNELQARLGTP